MFKDKGSFRAHISAFWLIYVIFAIASTFIWFYVVRLYTQDKPEETLNIWIMAYDVDVDELTKKLESEKADYLKHIRVSFEKIYVK